ARDLLELRWRERRAPAARVEHGGILRVECLLGKRLPLHEIDEVGGHIHDPFAFLTYIEKPLRPDERRAGDGLRKMVHALFHDRRFRRRAACELAEELAVLRERSLEHRGDL